MSNDALTEFLREFDEFVYFPSIPWNHTWERQQTIVSAFARAHGARQGQLFPPLGLIPHSPFQPESWKRLQRAVSSRFLGGGGPGSGDHDYPLPPNLSKVNGFFIKGAGAWRRRLTLAMSPTFRKLLRPSGRRFMFATYANELVLAFAERADFVLLDLAERRQASQRLEPRVKKLERELAARADVLVADNRATLEDYATERGAGREGHYLPQGFMPANWRVPTGSQPNGTLAYLGNLHHAIDYRWLMQLAEAHPNHSLRVCGAVLDPAARGLLRLPNVDYWGRIAHREIPRFLERVSWGLIPYAVDAWTAGVFPTKLFEYLDAGVPVLSTDIPEVAQFRHHPFVRIASDPADALPLPDLHGVREFLSEHTWEARLAAYGRILQESRT